MDCVVSGYRSRRSSRLLPTSPFFNLTDHQCLQGALFSAGETALIPFVKTAIMNEDGTPRRPAHPAQFKLLLIVSYGAFLFNASATISSLLLIDKLGEMPFLNREKTLRANQHPAVPEFVPPTSLSGKHQVLIHMFPALQTDF